MHETVGRAGFRRLLDGRSNEPRTQPKRSRVYRQFEQPAKAARRQPNLATQNARQAATSCRIGRREPKWPRPSKQVETRPGGQHVLRADHRRPKAVPRSAPPPERANSSKRTPTRTERPRCPQQPDAICSSPVATTEIEMLECARRFEPGKRLETARRRDEQPDASTCPDEKRSEVFLSLSV